MKKLLVLFGLVGACGGDAVSTTHDASAEVTCPANVDSQPACTVAGQVCQAPKSANLGFTSATCAGCGPYHWETDQVAYLCDGGNP